MLARLPSERLSQFPGQQRRNRSRCARRLHRGVGCRPARASPRSAQRPRSSSAGPATRPLAAHGVDRSQGATARSCRSTSTGSRTARRSSAAGWSRAVMGRSSTSSSCSSAGSRTRSSGPASRTPSRSCATLAPCWSSSCTSRSSAGSPRSGTCRQSAAGCSASGSSAATAARSASGRTRRPPDRSVHHGRLLVHQPARGRHRSPETDPSNALTGTVVIKPIKGTPAWPPAQPSA